MLIWVYVLCFLPGVYQDVTANLHTGSSAIEAGSKITLKPFNGLLVDTDLEKSDVQGETDGYKIITILRLKLCLSGSMS